MEPNQQDSSPVEPTEGAVSQSSSNRRLRAAIRRVFQDSRMDLADMRNDPDHRLRSALSQVCSDARHAGLRAEQLLVLIKEVWAGLPAALSRTPSVHGDERLNHVISVCVDEYYGSGETRP